MLFASKMVSDVDFVGGRGGGGGVSKEGQQKRKFSIKYFGVPLIYLQIVACM